MHAVDHDRLDVLRACFHVKMFSKEDVNKTSDCFWVSEGMGLVFLNMNFIVQSLLMYVYVFIQ
jgi:hypothetical protein